MSFKVKHLVLCEYLWNNDSGQKEEKIDILMKNISSNGRYTEQQLQYVRNQLVIRFLAQYKKMWQKVSRTKTLFLSKYVSFLNKYFEVKFNFVRKKDPKASNKCHAKKGRPPIS